MSTATTTSQVSALMRRYLIAISLSPIKSSWRLLILPLFILGLSVYTSLELQEDEELFEIAVQANSIPMIILFMTILNIYNFCELLVSDKATGIRSLMYSMGLKRFSYYLANSLIMIAAIMPFVLAVAIGSLLLDIFLGSLASNYTILGVFILFTFHLTGLMFALTSFITSTTYVAFIFFAILLEQLFHYIVLYLMTILASDRHWLLLFMASASPFESLRIFCQSYILCENCDNTQYDPDSELVSQPTHLIIVAMIFWTTAAFVFATWFDRVCPWQTDSAPRSPLFCFSSGNQYGDNQGCSSGAAEYEVENEETMPKKASTKKRHKLSKFFELANSSSLDRQIGIRIKDVTKKFKGSPVVNGLSFDVYRGETTLLLGHNGAGKTTLMNMILGKLRPDGGKVIMEQESGKPDGSESATGQSVGVCPQASVLDPSLSVRQHLHLFANIKTSSMSGEELEKHIKQTIEDVGLTDHQQKLPLELSGGMRRKLSLALAFVGGSNILILDEPSSGLDPDSRVFIWNAIRRYRVERTVLLSTQHMEEADYLGDRIAIMSKGKIVCCGSSTFLNQNFGSGYKLRVECLMSKRQEIFDFVRNYFPQAQIPPEHTTGIPLADDTESYSDLVIQLKVDGHKSDYKHQGDSISDSLTTDSEMPLISMLEELEQNTTLMKLVKSHGLKSSSIEDVMLATNKFSLSRQEEESGEEISPNQVKNNSGDLSLNSNQQHHFNIDVDKLQNHMANVLLFNPIRYSTGDVVSPQLLLLRALMIKHLLIAKHSILTTLFSRLGVAAMVILHLINELNVPSPDYSPSTVVVVMTMFFVYLPTLEQTSKFKSIQLASGLKFTTYWLSWLLSDLVTVGLQIICMLTFMLALFDGFYIESAVFVLTLISLTLLLFGISSALIAYIQSTFLDDAKTALRYYIFLFIASPAVHLLLMFIGSVFDSELEWLNQSVTYLFVGLLPSDAFMYVLYGLGKKCYIRPSYEETCRESDITSPVCVGIIALICQVLVYGCALYVIERDNYDLAWYFRWRNWTGVKRQALNSNVTESSGVFLAAEDEDVVDESRKAVRLIGEETTTTGQVSPGNNNSLSGISLVAAELSKSYLKGNKVIDRLSFTVNKNECFGLLGVNGAGKSTTFSMLAGEVKSDGGKIWMNDNYVYNNIDKNRRKLGYDPQANPDMLLTASEALHLMARLRFVKEDTIEPLVNAVVEVLEISEHKNKLIKDLSGGTKRKLALGMSLIGSPSLLALDEPTTGVDPIARRSIWSLLRALRSKAGASIVISSHAMEECEAICDRISIMARGKLRCIGTFLHLKNKFSQGCTIRVQASAAVNCLESNSRITQSMDDVSKATSSLMTGEIVQELTQKLNQVTESGKAVQVSDTNANSVTFSVNERKVQRSKLFKVLREFKRKYPNLSYMINDSSLEDIFIALANEQQQLDATSDGQIHLDT